MDRATSGKKIQKFMLLFFNVSCGFLIAPYDLRINCSLRARHNRASNQHHAIEHRSKTVD